MAKYKVKMMTPPHVAPRECFVEADRWEAADGEVAFSRGEGKASIGVAFFSGVESVELVEEGE